MNRKQKIILWLKNNPAHVIGYTVFLIVFFSLNGERIINNFKSEGIELPIIKYEVLSGSTEKNLLYPIENSNSVLLFWATWCTPCKVEMDRLKRSVESGTLKGSSIFLINPFEEKEASIAHLKKYAYPFIFLHDSNDTLKRKLKISQTPTMLFLKGNFIKRMSTGISLTGIYQAESFLKTN